MELITAQAKRSVAIVVDQIPPHCLSEIGSEY